jgi:hypothetical protein
MGRQPAQCSLIAAGLIGPRLARLWGSWFTEGFHTADLKEAKALLDQLA